ncbi:MAG: type II toxin-antitoxin system RelE/ParE family toxin [Bacteroidota bacterium]
MAKSESKEVKVSEQFNSDIISLYSFGEEVFGEIAAKSFIADIYSRIWSLDKMFLLHPECRHLTTNDKRYRNIIIGSYLIIYRITSEAIEVLRILHSHSSIKRIQTARKLKL